MSLRILAQHGATPLHVACSAGQCDAVDTLIVHGATVDAKNSVRHKCCGVTQRAHHAPQSDAQPL